MIKDFLNVNRKKFPGYRKIVQCLIVNWPTKFIVTLVVVSKQVTGALCFDAYIFYYMGKSLNHGTASAPGYHEQ